MRAVRFSIAIPLHRDNPSFRRCLDECLALDHPDFEVVVVSDREVDLPDDPRVVAVVGGRDDDSSPAEKRDLALTNASGDAIAYLDDDAYPPREWLRVAEAALGEEGVEAIGGPGVTPPGSSLPCRVGGAVYESTLGSGPLRFRFTPRAAREVDDYPAYNLIVAAGAVRRVGGWASTFYGGEDTRFCERLAELGVRIHYRPDLLVYHHRRPVFRAHMRQIANVGRHRGYFARVYPGTSLRPVYFLPLVGVVGVLGVGAALTAARGVRTATLAGALAYATVGATSPARSIRERSLFPLALLAHHTSYGLAFLRGLVTKEMER